MMKNKYSLPNNGEDFMLLYKTTNHPLRGGSLSFHLHE